MSAVIWRALRGLAVVFLLGLGACGGGGDDTSITVSPHSLNFSADYASALPAPQSIDVSYSGDGLIVGYPPDSGDTSWLQVVQASAGDPIQFYVVPNTASLPVGTYKATLRFLTGHADGSGVKVADVAVTYVVSVPFSASANDIVFQQVDGQLGAVTTQTVSITKADNRFSVATDRPWLHAVVHPAAAAGGTVDINVDSTGLGQGTYSGVVTVADNSQGRSPLQLSVSLVIRNPNLNSDHSTLVLTGVSDQTSLPGTPLSLTSETTREIPFTETTTYATGANNWLQSIAAGTTPATKQVSASTTALAPGAYTATLHFSPANGAPQVDIPVTYTLRAAALTLSPGSSVSFLVDANTAAGALSQTLTLGDDGAPMTWMASADVSWLKLSRTSGDTRSNGSLAISIPTNQLSNLKDGTYGGSVTIRYGSPSVPGRVQVVPVSLSVALPEISEVIPAFAATNAGLTHVVRGQGFASIKGQKIHVGGQSLDVAVLSDDLARITIPTLSANTYSVSVDNNLGLARGAGVLTAKDVPQYTAVDLPRNYQANRVVYDEGRQAIYSLDIDLSNPYGSTPTVRRYSYSAGNWQENVVISLTDIFDIALSADGNTMFLAIADKIYSLDLTNSSANIVPIGGLADNPGFYIISGLSPLADGQMLVVEGIRGSGFTSVFLFDPKKTGLKQIGSASCGMTGSSADRTRALLVQQCVSPSQPVQAYNVVLGTLSSTSYSTNGSQNQIALERSGILQAVDDKVFDQNFNLLASVGIFSTGISFSPDSKRLYSVYSSYDANDFELQVFDTSGSPAAGKYPLLKSYPVPSNISRTYLNISIDGRTAFLVANAHFFVIPLSN